MLQYHFATEKLGRSLNLLSENLCFLHSNVMFMYNVVLPKHLDARTTISRDVFYYILASKLPIQKN